MAHVLALNGSPRKKGNTSQLIELVLCEIEKSGHTTEIIQIGNEVLTGCMACYTCKKKKNNECKYKDDIFNFAFSKCREADVIILGSPVYVGGMTAQLKAFIDRACLVNRANGEPFKRKLGAAVVAVRRNGALETFNAINNFFTISQMIIVGSNYWNQGIGRDPGEVMNDEEGLITMRTLGENICWLLDRMNNPGKSQEKITPKKEKKPGKKKKTKDD